MNILRLPAAAAALAFSLTLGGSAIAAGTRPHEGAEQDEPWLLPAERALIARKCGEASDERDGETITLSDGILVCGDGRRVDDPEVRAMVAELSPRIARRVEGLKNLAVLRDGTLERALENVQRALSRLDRR